MSAETKIRPTDEAVQVARRDFERQLDGVRDALATEVGSYPRRKGYWVLLIAGVTGLALGAGARKKRARLKD